MPDLRILGSINLYNTTKYRVPVASENENKIYEIVANPIRNTSDINLGMADHTATELTMDVWVTGTTWQEVLDNFADIQQELDAAAAFSIAGTGSQITYQEQAGNQLVATVYNVKWGRFTEIRSRRLLERLRTVGQLYLYCEPHA